jgi:hypothetical protein
MAELFSKEWVSNFMHQWNAEPDLIKPLEKAGFSSVIGYGFDKEDKPAAYVSIENGKITDAGLYEDQKLDLDVRCGKSLWKKWLKKPPGMVSMGMAFSAGKIKLKVGDFKAIMKDSRIGSSFIRSFTVMARA